MKLFVVALGALVMVAVIAPKLNASGEYTGNGVYQTQIEHKVR